MKTIIILIALSAFSVTAQASLVGDEILVQQFGPTIDTPCGLGTNTWQFTVTADDSDAFTSCGGGVDVNVQGNSIFITKNNSAVFGGGDFSGFVFSSLDWLPEDRVLTDVVNLTAGIAPDAGIEILSASSFSLNVAGQLWATNTVAEFKLTTVPVPAAMWLFGSALVGLGWLRRKQTI